MFQNYFVLLFQGLQDVGDDANARDAAGFGDLALGGGVAVMELLVGDDVIDPWNPRMRYRFETFWYGSKSCKYYKPGPRRVVLGCKGMSWKEPDWLDEEATAHHGMDE